MSQATPPKPSPPDSWPECEEFYNLMQNYRHAPIYAFQEVTDTYESVKQWLRDNRAGLADETAPKPANPAKDAEKGPVK